jgi:hypothetical protein
MPNIHQNGPEILGVNMKIEITIKIIEIFHISRFVKIMNI